MDHECNTISDTAQRVYFLQEYFIVDIVVNP